MDKKLLLGAHTSAAGGAFNAIKQGEEIGATTIQFFTSNQRQWKGRVIPQEELATWQSLLQTSKLSTIMSHASYLINLGSPNKEGLEKSRKAFCEEIERCHLFGVSFLNFHPGAALDKSEQQCLDTIIESLLSFADLCKKGSTRLLLETTAGQGSTVGHQFSHLAYIIERCEQEIPIGVCIDTCHIFSAGYDIRTKDKWEKVLQEFDRVIGLKHLYAFHINDSMKDLGSRRDRHAHLGEGKIGKECFQFLVQSSLTRDLPMYLETPDPKRWEEEIAMLRRWSE